MAWVWPVHVHSTIENNAYGWLSNRVQTHGLGRRVRAHRDTPLLSPTKRVNLFSRSCPLLSRRQRLAHAHTLQTLHTLHTLHTPCVAGVAMHLAHMHARMHSAGAGAGCPDAPMTETSPRDVAFLFLSVALVKTHSKLPVALGW